MTVRQGIAASAVIGYLLVAAPVAQAVTPPDIDAIPVTTPDDPPPAPPVPMEQKTQCARSGSLPDSAYDRPAPANVAFGVDSLHSIATGDGVTVAVIDSGVNKNERLPHLTGGGDYIAEGDGLEDCDHHGTLIAGIIGAAPSDEDAFVGVAPDADLISIRQTSGAYEPKDQNGDGPEGGSSTLSTLASAVVHAANMGADVINLSVTACVPAAEFVATDDLAAALKYAVTVKDAVIVTAAGNDDGHGCSSNALYNPTHPNDRRNWTDVTTMSMPSAYSPLVLSVGGTTLTGDVYPETMAGPWIDVAAPAQSIVSLDPDQGQSGGLVNSTVTEDGQHPIGGTSFASAYVAGLAALIRQHEPDLPAKAVMDRIRNTAHTPGAGALNFLGHGVVDPMAALTYTTAAREAAMAPPSRAVAADPAADTATLARTIAIAVLAVASALGIVTVIVRKAMKP